MYLIENLTLLFTALGAIASLFVVAAPAKRVEIERARTYLEVRDKLGDSGDEDYKDYLTEAAKRCIQVDSQKYGGFHRPWYYPVLLLMVSPSLGLNTYHIIEEFDRVGESGSLSMLFWAVVTLVQAIIVFRLFWSWREEIYAWAANPSLPLSERRRTTAYYTANHPGQAAQLLLIVFIIVLLVSRASTTVASSLCLFIIGLTCIAVCFRDCLRPVWRRFRERHKDKGWFKFLFDDPYKME